MLERRLQEWQVQESLSSWRTRNEASQRPAHFTWKNLLQCTQLRPGNLIAVTFFLHLLQGLLIVYRVGSTKSQHGLGVNVDVTRLVITLSKELIMQGNKKSDGI
jgi:hypothetical protein